MVVDYSETVSYFPQMFTSYGGLTNRQTIWHNIDFLVQVPILDEDQIYTAFKACGQLCQFC